MSFRLIERRRVRTSTGYREGIVVYINGKWGHRKVVNTSATSCSMPPPTKVDDWLAGRRFGIVIDAGSSGSRLQIYSWRDAQVVRIEEGPKAYRSLPKVEKGTQDADGWVRKVEPGSRSFALFAYLY